MAERTRPVSTPTPQASSLTTDATTARFVLPAEEFALAALFERVPDARVKCEPAITNPDNHALVIVRADVDERSVAAPLQADPDIAAVERFGERPDGWTYRITWDGRPRQLVQRLSAVGVTILSTQGQAGRWKFRVATPDRETISRADEIMDDLGCKAECLSISSFDGNGSCQSQVTDDQREALLKAFETGYYDIPRDITAANLAEDLGISHQALSERFRRAHSQLVEETLVSKDSRL